MWLSELNGKYVKSVYIQTSDGMRKVENFYSYYSYRNIYYPGLRRWLHMGFFQFEISVDAAENYTPISIDGYGEIYWGDDTHSNISQDYRPASSPQRHYYNDAGKYVITIYGELKAIYTSGWGAWTPELLTQILSSVPSAVDSISFGQSNLTSIPPDLFLNAEYTRSFSNAFAGCTSITSIPAGLFDHCNNVVWLNNCFDGCTNLTGEAPPLWEMFPDTSHGNCFRGCTGLSNYNEIPSGWK